MASRAELKLINAVFVIAVPQTSRQPPHASITACVTFIAYFSVPACVFQKPGVLQIASDTQSTVAASSQLEPGSKHASAPVKPQIAVTSTVLVPTTFSQIQMSPSQSVAGI
jgi:hypothetical protein